MLLFTTLALAASHEISAEVAWLGASDAAWNRFSEMDTFGSIGVRGGFRLTENLAAIAGWTHGQVGADVYVGGDGEDEYDYDGGSSFHTAFYGDRFTLGVKADVRVNEYFHPYVTAQGAILRGLAKLDDNPEEDENLGQLQRSGVTGGFDAALGGEVPVALGESGLSVAPYVELGYGWLAPLQLEEMGAVRLRGFAGRAGFGLRF